MSAFLWKHFFQDDIDAFRHTLASASYVGSHARPAAASATTIASSLGHISASSPTLKAKGKARRGQPPIIISRADINAKNADGVTLLHCVASSASHNAYDYALALLEIPFLDLYVQDLESGWTALHRALYEGNIRMAHAFMEHDLLNYGSTGDSHVGGLIKIKDWEGNSPFDLYATTVASRDLARSGHPMALPGTADDTTTETSSEDATPENVEGRIGNVESGGALTDIGGDELYTFGSNKNLNLGLGDEDNRHFAARVALSRPACLLRRVIPGTGTKDSPQTDEWTSPGMIDLNRLPASVKFRPLRIQDIRMAKYHTAVLTSDPYANLYVCGFGPGGRLGTGDFSTCFRFISVLGGGFSRKKIAAVALGQDHTLAVTDQGEVFSWGSNAYGQLGLTNLPPPAKDEVPMQLLPRQVFATIKREHILGCAASALHSVIFSSGALYTFGKNEGQLGLVDANAAALKTQSTPRRVAASRFSSTITMVSAIDHATVCLLENHEVWIFANFGYSKVSFELDGHTGGLAASSLWRQYTTQTCIVKVASGGDTVCALSDRGEVFTLTVKSEKPLGKASTTNPNKIRGLLSPAQRIWTPRKSHMTARDVDVSQDGAIVVCTKAGSVWRRMRRAKIQDPDRPKDGLLRDYKFSRVPILSRVVAVRSNAFGAFAAVRKEDDVLESQVRVSPSRLWQDVAPLLPFLAMNHPCIDSSARTSATEALASSNGVAGVRRAVLQSQDLEADLGHALSKLSLSDSSTYDVRLGIAGAPLRIPCHEFILIGRSQLLRNAFVHFRQSYYHRIPDVLSLEYDANGEPVVLFENMDLLTLINVVFFVYTDGVVDVWNHTKTAPRAADRYRQVRTEVVKLAAQLQLKSLEQAARLLAEPPKLMHHDLEAAFQDPTLFENSDVEIVLHDSSVKAHSAMLCQRCPFFEGLFHGRAAGGWIRSRRAERREPTERIRVDLEHVDPHVFEFVLRHIYADTGQDMFDDSEVSSLDNLLDLILEVMSVANELMLDRLAEICQAVLAKFTDLRNVCQLLNAVAPCSVTQFKDAALEYICLNLEPLLENRLLGELDEDLIFDLDKVVRDNQLAAMPRSKSRKLESELLEAHPELLEAIEIARQEKIAAMIRQYRLREDTLKGVKPQRGGPEGKTQSPNILPKTISADEVFEMDDDIENGAYKSLVESHDKERAGVGHVSSTGKSSSDNSALVGHVKAEPASISPGIARKSSLRAESLDFEKLPQPHEQTAIDHRKDRSREASAAPWGPQSLETPKLDMKQIMAQAALHQESGLSDAISKEKMRRTPVATRLSQRERKRQFQEQQKPHAQLGEASEDATPEATPSKPTATVWQTVTRTARVSLKDMLDSAVDALEPAPSKARVPSAPSLTMRQTVPGNVAALHRSSAEPTKQNGRPAHPRSVSTPLDCATFDGSPLAGSSAAEKPPGAATPQLTPHTVRHGPPVGEPSLQLSMADILAQQQTEKDILREVATARRSLREIQEEQAFQEWWDQEEAATRARMEAEEQQRQGQGSTSSGRAGRGGRKGRGRRGSGPAATTRGRGQTGSEGNRRT